MWLLRMELRANGRTDNCPKCWTRFLAPDPPGLTEIVSLISSSFSYSRLPFSVSLLASQTCLLHCSPWLSQCFVKPRVSFHIPHFSAYIINPLPSHIASCPSPHTPILLLSFLFLSVILPYIWAMSLPADNKQASSHASCPSQVLNVFPDWNPLLHTSSSPFLPSPVYYLPSLVRDSRWSIQSCLLP